MITGRAEEVVKRRKHELTRSLLAQTCTIKDQQDLKTYSQVRFCNEAKVQNRSFKPTA